MVAVLTPIYEAEFLGFSYGFRPGRGQHDALDALAYGIGQATDQLDPRRRHPRVLRHDQPSWLIRFVEHRIGDRRIIRLIRKWLKAGVLEEGRQIETTEGTPQGAVISPLLANVYLHYVYDLWVRQWRHRHATGDMIVVRYADDTIVGFEHRHDAERFLSGSRLNAWPGSGSVSTPTRRGCIEFGRGCDCRPPCSMASASRRRSTFSGSRTTAPPGEAESGFVLGRTPIRKRMRAKLREIKEHLRATRHDGIEAQGQWLAQVLRGWLAYYAVPMSAPAITAFRHHLVERWLRAIRRRGQKHRLPWRRMKQIARRYLPYPRILHPWPEQRFLVNHPR